MAKKAAVAGRGRKTCPTCGKTLGARTLVCECGHEFPRKTRAKKDPYSPYEMQLEELEAIVKARKELIKPLGQLIEKYGPDVVLAETTRLAGAKS